MGESAKPSWNHHEEIYESGESAFVSDLWLIIDSPEVWGSLRSGKPHAFSVTFMTVFEPKVDGVQAQVVKPEGKPEKIILVYLISPKSKWHTDSWKSVRALQ